MEQLLALAILLVAFATLFFVNVFNRRFRVYDQRFGRAEQDVNELRAGQRDSVRQLAEAEDRAAGKSVQQAKKAGEDLATRYRSDWQGLTGKQQELKDESAALASRVGQLSQSVETMLREHGARLDALDRLAATLSARADASAEAAGLTAEIDRQAASVRELRGDVTQASEQTAAALSGLREQLLALAGEVHLLDTDRQDLRSQLRKWLDHSARQANTAHQASSAHRAKTDPADSIMPGFVATGERAAAELLPGLYEAVLRAIDVEPVFREHAETGDVFYYLAWRHPNGQSPRRRLEDLLAASPDDGASAAGLTEFRSLLLALRAGGPGTVRLGPLVIGQTGSGGFVGAVMTADEAAEPGEDDLGAAPARWAAWLAELDDVRSVDLAGWAAGRLS
jgi:hypothetical protein